MLVGSAVLLCTYCLALLGLEACCAKAFSIAVRASLQELVRKTRLVKQLVAGLAMILDDNLSLLVRAAIAI